MLSDMYGSIMQCNAVFSNRARLFIPRVSGDAPTTSQLLLGLPCTRGHVGTRFQPYTKLSYSQLMAGRVALKLHKDIHMHGRGCIVKLWCEHWPDVSYNRFMKVPHVQPSIHSY